MKRITRRTTKGQIMLIMLLFVVPLLAMLLLYNVYMLRVLNKKITLNNENTIYLYETLLEQDINSAQYYLSNSLANDRNFLRWNYQLDTLETYMCGQNIIETYEDYLNTHKNTIGALFAYSEKYDMFRISYNKEKTYRYEQKTAIKNYLYKIMKENKIGSGWSVYNIDGKKYVMLILKNGATYAGTFIDFDLVIKPQDKQGSGDIDFLMYASMEGEPLIYQNYLEDNHIEIRQTKKSYYITGNKNNFMVVQRPLVSAGINQLYITHYQGILNYMDVSQIILLTMSCLITLSLPLVYLILRRTYFVPLNRLITTMESIKEGNMEAKMSENYQIDEFLQVSKTFNEMIEQIKWMRIAAYEKEMETKNAQMQYLQIQIRPHFFLNCLKNFYALAEQKKFQEIQDMIIVLSDYLRRMFRNNSVLISVSDEMENVRNYILLQQMSLSNPPSCNIDIDTSLMDFQIPPLSILTFVENSVKHGRQTDRNLIISVRISFIKDEQESFVCITILDNGSGFRDEVLEKINGTKGELDRENIGISNVKKRIELIYGERANIIFSRSNGSCIEIYLPYENKANEAKK
ncbi:two-component system, sensor histidine kinase YesM [Anaerocolumna jejuensis DSM 15929]|uniref:Two-component system, sensor histidine kinase YesM n=1 Tax=Anaerocolumna jejuensis DSM 15929 TaxID=1121322 RepID=A0A1M6ZWZ5_9FIRM|nr:histidine kinase [Anaerocolumna jejuensis]SHL34954.1 two-component system, sensor histidine kinase YesM [Anaerocolumna jejuensis DSM 15929]